MNSGDFKDRRQENVVLSLTSLEFIEIAGYLRTLNLTGGTLTITEYKSGATKFASPDRSSPERIKILEGEFREAKLLCELLDAMPDLVLILNGNRQIVFGNKAIIDLATSTGCNIFCGLHPGELLSCSNAIQAESGIGTYSIKLLSEKYLGGKTTFTSILGAGTLFTVSLPQKSEISAK